MVELKTSSALRGVGLDYGFGARAKKSSHVTACAHVQCYGPPFPAKAAAQ